MKKLYTGDWIELRKTEDAYAYEYMHDLHGAGHGVAILIHDDYRILGRFERTPCHSPYLKLCSLTGGVEEGSPIDTAVREIKEEAGIDCKASDLVPLGICYPSKAADTIMHMYALTWTGEINPNPPGDGSKGEAGAYVAWIGPEEAANCSDPLLPCMMVRFATKKNSEVVV